MKKWKLIRKLLLITICFFIFLYLFLTSSLALKTVLQPALSLLFDFPVSVEEINYSPFTSKFEVKNVKLGYKDEPFVVCKHATCTADNIFSLPLGHINFSDISVDGATFRTVISPEGKWNYPWLEDDFSDLKEPPVILDLKNIKIKNSKLLLLAKHNSPDKDQKLEVYRATASCPRFANFATAKIDYKGHIKIKGRKVDLSQSNISGKIKSYFNGWTVPETLQSTFYLDKIKGYINNLDLEENSVKVITDIDSAGKIYSINNIQFLEKHKNILKSDISFHGEFNPFSNTANLSIKAMPMSPEIINLFFNTFTKCNFGNMKFYYIGDAGLSHNEIFNIGKLVVNDFEITSNDKKAKAKVPYDISLNYSLNYNTNSKTITFQNLESFFSKNLVDLHDKFITTNIKKALTLSVDNKIKFRFSDKTNGEFIGEKSTGKIELNNFDVRFLNLLLINMPRSDIISGASNGVFDFSIAPMDNDINFKGKLNTTQFSFKANEHSTHKLQLIEDFNCTLHNFTTLKIDPFILKLNSDQKEKVIKSTLNGSIDFYKQQMKMDVAIPMLTDAVLNYLPIKLRNNVIFKGITNQLKPFNIKTKFTILLDVLNKLGGIGNTTITVDTVKYDDSNFELKNFIPFSWDNRNFNLKKNISADINLTDINTTFLNAFLPKNFPFKFNKGNLNSFLKCKFDRTVSQIDIDGKLNMPEIGIDLNKNNLESLDVNALYEIDYYPNKNKISFNKTNIILDINRENALSLEASGNYTHINNIFNFNANILNANKQLLYLIPGLNPAGILRLNSTGQFDIKHQNNRSAIDLLLNLSQMIYLSPKTSENRIPFNHGTVIVSAENSDKGFKINKALFDLFKNKGNKIFNLGVNCFIPNNKGTTTLNLNSSVIYADVIKEIISSLSHDKLKKVHAAGKSKPKKKKNSNRKGISFEGRFDLQNIHYNKQTVGTVQAEAVYKNKNLKLSPITILLNKSKISGDFNLNHLKKNIYPYYLKLTTNSLPIESLLGFFGIADSKIKGNIQKANINIKGINRPFSKSKYKKLKGNLLIKAN